MEIKNSYSKTSFGAKFLSSSIIKKKIPFTPFKKNEKVSFVELNSTQDLLSLINYATNYTRGNSLTYDTIINMKKNKNNHKTYAITRQQNTFSILNPRDILGVCDGEFLINNKNKIVFFLSNIETQSPKNNLAILPKKEIPFLGFKFKIKEKYTQIGKELLKKVVSDISRFDIVALQLQSLSNKKNFYKHLKFEELNQRGFFSLPKARFKEFINN